MKKCFIEISLQVYIYISAIFPQEFPDKPELLRNMMGLLGNVAEVKDLRSRLMTPELLTTFAELLDSNSDGIEVRLWSHVLVSIFYLEKV